MRFRVPVCYALVAIFASITSASFAGPPFDTDDPGTPEIRHFELNITYKSNQVRGSEGQLFPNFDLGYGFNNNVSFGVSMGGVSTREAGSGRIAGFNDTNLGAKWRFLEETRRGPQAALAYGLKIPSASRSRGLGTGKFDHAVVLSVQKSFGRSALTANAGVSLPGDTGSRTNGLYALLYSFQASEKMVIGAEVVGNSSAAAGERANVSWGVGMNYTFAPDRSFFFKAGRSTEGFSDLSVSAGVQLVFGK